MTHDRSANDDGNAGDEKERAEDRVQRENDGPIGHRLVESWQQARPGVGRRNLGVKIYSDAETQFENEHDDYGQTVRPESVQPSSTTLSRLLCRVGHNINFPPEMSMVAPVIHDDADEARKSVAAATSSG